MTKEEVDHLAKSWIDYWHAPINSDMRIELNSASEREFDLLDDDPESLWKLILAIHRLDQSPQIDQLLSADPSRIFLPNTVKHLLSVWRLRRGTTQPLLPLWRSVEERYDR